MQNNHRHPFAKHMQLCVTTHSTLSRMLCLYSSTTAYSLISLLSSLCRTHNYTIIISIHSPSSSSFTLFDDVMLMSKGEIVYHGCNSDSVRFFESMGMHVPEYVTQAEHFCKSSHFVFCFNVWLLFEWVHMCFVLVNMLHIENDADEKRVQKIKRAYDARPYTVAAQVQHIFMRNYAIACSMYTLTHSPTPYSLRRRLVMFM